MISEITDKDRAAIADTYGRTRHDPAAFILLKERAAAGIQADLYEISEWRSLIDQLFDGAVTTEIPDARAETMNIIFRGLDGDSAIPERSTEYTIALGRCADLLFEAGYTREPSTLAQELLAAQTTIAAMTAAVDAAESQAADRVRVFLEQNYACACAADDPDCDDEQHEASFLAHQLFDGIRTAGPVEREVA